jgi:hypothetical protein
VAVLRARLMEAGRYTSRADYSARLVYYVVIMEHMNNVVYLLGAGFSAPLGLPVMSNFLDRSKDMYFADNATYAHFLPVFETINVLTNERMVRINSTNLYLILQGGKTHNLHKTP